MQKPDTTPKCDDRNASPDENTDYRDVFEIPELRRHVDRQRPAGATPKHCKHLIEQFWKANRYYPDEYGRIMPGKHLPAFFDMLRYLPSRLDADTWVAKHVLKLYDLHYTSAGAQWPGTFEPWKPSDERVCYGEQAHGNVVFYPDSSWPTCLYLDLSRMFRIQVETQIQRIHHHLAAIALRIAYLVAYCVIVFYVWPRTKDLGRVVLPIPQVVRAAGEILGDDWFALDLYFTPNEKLVAETRAWKNARRPQGFVDPNYDQWNRISRARKGQDSSGRDDRERSNADS